jgi:hypothetical protein
MVSLIKELETRLYNCVCISYFSFLSTKPISYPSTKTTDKLLIRRYTAYIAVKRRNWLREHDFRLNLSQFFWWLPVRNMAVIEEGHDALDNCPLNLFPGHQNRPSIVMGGCNACTVSHDTAS